MRWMSLIGLALVAWLSVSPAEAQEHECRNWREDPEQAIDGCTRLLSYLEATGSGHWLYKERGYAYAYFGRAAAHAALGQHDQAIADYTLSIQNDPSAPAYNNRGNSYAAKGDVAKARSDFSEAVRLDPSNEVAKQNLASLQAAPKRAAATPEQQDAASRGRNLIGCIKGGDFDDILAACDRVLYGSETYTVSQRAEAYASRGRVQLYRKEFSSAADDLGQAVKLRPDVVSYQADLAKAEAGLGTKAAAVPPVRPQTELVRRAQLGLARLGYGPGSADGRAGPRTTAAVRTYQQSTGLPADGVITAELVAQIEAQPR